VEYTPFIGDAVMGVFGISVPNGREADNTLAAALALRDAMLAWGRERERAGLAPVRVGVGAHFGAVFAGAVGDEERVEFTVIGDTVNVASRIEEATKVVGVSLLTSRDLLAAAGVTGDDPAWTAVPPGPVRGRSGQVELCRLSRDDP
jgi:adenylate cyclase